MKIALVNKAFSPKLGGGERYALNLAGVICRAGHEVHLFGSFFEDVPQRALCHVITVPQWPTYRKLMAFNKNVRLAMKNTHFDIVYGLTQCYPVNLYRMGGGVYKHWINLRYDTVIKKFFTFLTHPTHLAHLSLESELFKPHNCPLFITNSHLCKEHAMSYYGVPEVRIEVIYTGVNRTIFHPGVRKRYRDSERKRLKIEKDEIVLVFISHNWKRKGLETIMRALHHLGTEGKRYKLICVGKSKRRPFEKLANICGLQDRVIFCPPSEDIEKYYALADLFVLPTLYDPFSNVCLEAMACGVPVITSAANGASEIIEHGLTGYVLNNPRDFMTLSELLRKSMDDNLRNEMGDRAARSVESFTIENNMDQTLKVFDKILSNFGTPE